MIRTNFCFFVASLLLATTISAQESDTAKPETAKPETTTSETTTWNGTLDAGGMNLRLEIFVVEKQGSLTGELRSLDQGNAKLPITDVKCDEKKFSFSVPTIAATYEGSMNEKGDVAKGTFSQSGAQLTLSLTKSDGAATQAKKVQLKEAWIGKLKISSMEPVMQFRIVTAESGETKAYFDSITEGLTGYEATVSDTGNELVFEVEKIKLKYVGKLNESRDIAEGIWSQGGQELPLTLEKKNHEFEIVNVWENRPQRPVGPFPYDEEIVSFENQADDVMLAGTLTIPKKHGRYPAVVLISGSGPQDRDETLMGHKPFLVLADYLTRRGIAVLRYDDRGTAKSTGDFGPATTEDFARDASAAVEFLKHHERINPKQIGLAGHSEGGLIAPMVVGHRDDVAFVVLMAATGVDGIAISISQSEAMARAEGTDESEIQMTLAISRAVLDVIAKATPGSDISDAVDQAVEKVLQTIPKSEREKVGEVVRAELESQKSRMQGNWIRFFVSYDPRPALANIKCPVLAITGTKDLQVLPELNVPEIKKALTEGGNKDFEMVELEGLNHLFQKCETGSMNEYVSIQETFSPMALKKIGDWIEQRTMLVK